MRTMDVEQRMHIKQGMSNSEVNGMEVNGMQAGRGLLLSTFLVRNSRLARLRASASPWLILFVLGFAAPATAQVTVLQDDETNITTYRMTVSPAAEPEPAFKYRLLKHERDRTDGNAAPFYYRAQIKLDKTIKQLHEKYGDAYYDWIHIDDTPLEKLPKEKVRNALASFDGSVMEAFREATSRTYCDWGWELQNVKGPKIIEFLLPEIQEARSLSRMLALRTRLAIAEGRIDDAIDFTQMNYQLGQDVGKPPFLVCGLVGIAITTISNSHLLELIAASDSPNLYWAFAELPKPMVDLRRAVRFELGNGPRVFPLLEDAEKVSRSPQEWSRFVGQAWLDMLHNLGGPVPPFPPGDFPESIQTPEWEAIRAPLVGAGTALWTYTLAKQALIESGMAAERVEAMPAGQVIAVQASRAYRHTADEMEKLWYVPEMHRRGDAIQDALKREGYLGAGWKSKEVIPIASILLPATNAARTAQERLRRDMTALQVLEALRMHAAETGEFPAALEDITIVPVPKNPATGLPFVYHTKTDRNNRVAILELPTTDGFFIGKRYEITLR